MPTKSAGLSPEVRARAVRMVFEHRGEQASEVVAITSIATKIGCKAETLRLAQAPSRRTRDPRPRRSAERKIRVGATKSSAGLWDPRGPKETAAPEADQQRLHAKATWPRLVAK